MKNKVVETFEVLTSRFKYDRDRLGTAINACKTAGFPSAPASPTYTCASYVEDSLLSSRILASAGEVEAFLMQRMTPLGDRFVLIGVDNVKNRTVISTL